MTVYIVTGWRCLRDIEIINVFANEEKAKKAAELERTAGYYDVVEINNYEVEQ